MQQGMDELPVTVDDSFHGEIEERSTHRLVEREEARLQRHEVQVLVEHLGHQLVAVGGDGRAGEALHQGAVHAGDEVEVDLGVEPLAAVVRHALHVLLRRVQKVDGRLGCV